MGKNDVREEIIGLLEVILEQSETVCGYKNKIPQIEIDIVLSNIRKLYEKYQQLEKLNKSETFETKSIAEAKQTPELVKKEVIKENIPAVKENVAKPDLSEKESVQKQSEIIENISETEYMQKKAKPLKKTAVDLFTVNAPVADKIKDEKKSLNEVLSDNHTDQSLASKMQKNSIKNLKEAIGINEKFKFINRLFEGSLQKYNENISKLNESGSFKEANEYLSILKNEYKWEDTNDAYAELVELVNRRYK